LYTTLQHYNINKSLKYENLEHELSSDIIANFMEYNELQKLQDEIYDLKIDDKYERCGNERILCVKNKTLELKMSALITQRDGTPILNKTEEKKDNFPIKHIHIKNIVIIQSIGNGDCFFHSILYSVNKDYAKSNDKVQMAQKFRTELSEYLPSVYDKLSRGQLKDLSKDVPEYSLENMKKKLKSQQYVGHEFNELVGLFANIDIYIIDASKEDVYITGDEDYLIKDRDSIVLYYKNNHYNLLGIREDNGEISDFFCHDDMFIQLIKERIKNKTKKE
jgi:hypothetical protein